MLIVQVVFTHSTSTPSSSGEPGGPEEDKEEAPNTNMSSVASGALPIMNKEANHVSQSCESGGGTREKSLNDVLARDELMLEFLSRFDLQLEW